MRSEATIPASNTPPTAASSKATPSGMLPLAVKNDTFTDLVFWMTKTSRSTSTTTPMITPTHVPESRVRPVGFRGARSRRWGRLAASVGCGTGPSDVGSSLLMRRAAFSVANLGRIVANLSRCKPASAERSPECAPTVKNKGTDDGRTRGFCSRASGDIGLSAQATVRIEARGAVRPSRGAPTSQFSVTSWICLVRTGSADAGSSVLMVGAPVFAGVSDCDHLVLDHLARPIYGLTRARPRERHRQGGRRP